MHRAAVAHYGPSACIEGRDQGAKVARRERQQRTAPHRLRDALRKRIVAGMRWVICLARRPQKQDLMSLVRKRANERFVAFGVPPVCWMAGAYVHGKGRYGTKGRPHLELYGGGVGGFRGDASGGRAAGHAQRFEQPEQVLDLVARLLVALQDDINPFALPAIRCEPYDSRAGQPARKLESPRIVACRRQHHVIEICRTQFPHQSYPCPVRAGPLHWRKMFGLCVDVDVIEVWVAGNDRGAIGVCEQRDMGLGVAPP